MTFRPTSNIVPILLWTLLSVEVACAQGLTLQPRRVSDTLLVWILNNADIQDLDSLPSARDQELSLRLYSIRIEGPCVPETHMVCRHRYFLAASEYGQIPAQVVYDLGEVGHIGQIEWLTDHQRDRASLRIEIANYAPHAFRYNPSLVRETRVLRLEVGLDSLALTPVP